jgi:hypothetical protein
MHVQSQPLAQYKHAPGYSLIEHLARSILFSRFKGNTPVAMFSAYFDASGHPSNQKVLTVAGFVSTVKKWKRFEVEWNAILQLEGINEFHMTDFVSSQGEFANGWKGESTRRRNLIESLSACLKKNVNKSFRTTLILSGYEEVNRDYMFEEHFGRPYAFCCMVNVFSLRRWAERKDSRRNLLYFFEDGDKDKGNFEKLHKAAYKVNPQFLDKSEGIPFQAADFAGWKIRTSVQESLKKDHTLAKGVRLLESVQMLKEIPKTAGVLNGSRLALYCRDHRIERRRI